MRAARAVGHAAGAMPAAALAAALAAAAAAPGDPVAVLEIRTTRGCQAESVARMMGTTLHGGGSCNDDLTVQSPDRFSVVVDEALERRVAQHRCDVVARRPSAPFRNVSRRGGPPDGYTEPEQMLAAFRALAAAHPNIAALVDVTEAYGTPRTHEGRTITVLKVSDNVAEDEDEPNILVVPNHHARELIVPEIGLETARRLVEEYSTNADIRAIVDSNQVYVTWTWNPDGYAHAWDVNDNWRKNRRVNADGSFGVDLNRNYPFGWDYWCAGSETQSSNTYRGPSGASEAETETMIAFQNDRNFAKLLDLHSSGRDVRINYADCAELPQVVDDYYLTRAAALAAEMNYVTRRSCCTGGDISFAYNNRGTMALLSETGTSFQPPAAAMREEVQRVWPGVFAFLRMPIPAQGHVTDAETGGRLVGAAEASFTLPDLAFNEHETKQTRLGRYFLWLPSGEHRVTFSAPGYAPATVTVTTSAEGATLDVPLRRR